MSDSSIRITLPSGFLRYAYLVSALGISVLLGALYAYHNTDSHHWGFILGTALDFISGRELFTDVFIQYGVGGPILFKLLSYFLPITYTNIGLITVATYAGTMFLLFKTIEKIGSTSLAMIVTTFALLVHPYSIYPWGDYFAGFSLMATCYLLSGQERTRRQIFLAGLFLFLAFLFRNTYLVNLGVSAAIYLVAALLFRRVRDRALLEAVAVFVVLTAAYFGFLGLQGKIEPWYLQNFGAATTSYGVNATNASFALVYRILFPEIFATGVFSVLLAVGVYNIVISCFSKKTEELAPFVLFVSLLGATGFAQAAMIYEVFRLQNSCGPLFVSLACVIAAQERNGSLQIAKALRWAVGITAILLLLRLPSVLAGQTFSSWNPILQSPVLAKWDSYAPAREIRVLSNHSYQPDVRDHYAALAKLICNTDKRVVNLTSDPLIPYLCNDYRNQLAVPQFSEEWLKRTSSSDFEKVKTGNYGPNELIVAELVGQGGSQFVARNVQPKGLKGATFQPVLISKRPPSIPWIGGAGVVVLAVVPTVAAP